MAWNGSGASGWWRGPWGRRPVGISRRVAIPNRHPALKDLTIYIPRNGHLYLRPSVPTILILGALLQAATGGLERTGQRRPVEVEREAVRPLDEVCSHALPIGEHEFHARQAAGR